MRLVIMALHLRVPLSELVKVPERLLTRWFVVNALLPTPRQLLRRLRACCAPLCMLDLGQFERQACLHTLLKSLLELLRPHLGPPGDLVDQVLVPRMGVPATTY